MKNKQVGHMLRTKLSDADEGGVAAGSGALDSVFLLDVDRCCEIDADRCGCEHDEHSANKKAQKYDPKKSKSKKYGILTEILNTHCLRALAFYERQLQGIVKNHCHKIC